MHEKFMNKAADEALRGIHAGHGGPFGAVIVKNGLIIGRGHNRVIIDHDPIMHGEIVAIRDACRRVGSHNLSGCAIYTTAQPCPMCLSAIMWAGISEIYYGCSAEDTASIGFRDAEMYERLRENAPCGTEVCRDKCLEIFSEYQNSEEKELY